MYKTLFLAILGGLNFGFWQESFNAASFMIILLILIVLLWDKK